ncbi:MULTISPECIES: transposase [Myxococcus]|uniref:transposase n=1 Tax=Myxococcus TaxID=32 RepID=UPI0013900A5A|nr:MULTISPECIES: transposase [Myxococcus]NOK00105.1 transposase [Myxococcus xanthus]
MTPPSEEKKPVASPVPKKWTPEEKLRVQAAAQELKGEELGALLRGEGLHEAQLREWQQTATGVLSGTASEPLPAKERKRLAAAEKRVKELERELHREEKALAETAALLVLEKLQAMGWDERHLADERTTQRTRRARNDARPRRRGPGEGRAPGGHLRAARGGGPTHCPALEEIGTLAARARYWPDGTRCTNALKPVTPSDGAATRATGRPQAPSASAPL